MRALLLAVLLAAGCREQAPPHTVAVEGATLRYDGRELRWDLPAPRWEEVLGPRSRRVGDVSTWDDLGVFLFHSHEGQEPRSFVVLLGRKPHAPDTSGEPEYWPRRTFAGRLIVNGSPPQELPKTFRQGHLPTIYDSIAGDFYLALHLGYDRTPTTFSVSRR